MTSDINARTVWRGDARYEELRTDVWNQRKEFRVPAGILRPETTDDVCGAVALAKDKGLKVAVRSGGHSWWGASVRDDSLLIDLSNFNGVEIDVSTKTATIGPAIRGRDLASALAAKGLFFPVGHCSTVGMGGFLLAGGLGWGFGSLGPSCFHVLSFDAVLANGQKVSIDTAAPGEHADLVWAQRGAGPGFPAVITSFKLRVIDMPVIYSLTTVYPIDELKSLGIWSDGMMKSGAISPQVEYTMFAAPAPPPLVEKGFKRVAVVSASIIGATHEECVAALAPAACYPGASKAIFHVGAHPVTLFELLDESDGGFMPGRYTSNVCFTNLDAESLYSTIAPLVASPPDSRSLVFMIPTAPPPPGFTPPDAAMSVMGNTVCGLYGISSDSKLDVACASWVASVTSAVQPNAYYTGECNMVAAKDRASMCFSALAWERLARVRASYDPQSLFVAYPTECEISVPNDPTC